MIVNLLHANLATVLAVLSGTVIPAVSALVTRRPSFATGVWTAFLSAAAGFIAQWAAAPDINTYDWRAGLSTALSTLVLAFVSHKVAWSGAAAAKLHAIGPAEPLVGHLDPGCQPEHEVGPHRPSPQP